METDTQQSYQRMETPPSKWTVWMPRILCLTIVLLCVTTGLAIYFGVELSSDDDNSSSNSDNDSSNTGGDSGDTDDSDNTYALDTDCTTAACIELADNILSAIDTSIDPCEDFFKYSCNNWVKENDFELLDYSIYSQFGRVAADEKEAFLGALFYNTNETLINHTSVTKAKKFFRSCRDSETTELELEESSVLQEFIDMVNFTGDNGMNISAPWDDMMKSKFLNATVYLTVREWNYFFETSFVSYGEDSFGNIPQIYQNYEIWLYYESDSYGDVINETYVPLYKSYFGLSDDEAVEMGVKVKQFSDSMSSITTANSIYEDESLLGSTYWDFTSISALYDRFDESDILNLTALLYKTYDDKDMVYLLFYTPFVNYFNNLTVLLADTPPIVVQYFMYTSVLLNGLDFGGTLEQSSSIDRTTFCFSQILEYFPFVYGYIIKNVLYSNSKYEYITGLVSNITTNGIGAAIYNASWLDATSLDNSIKKLDNMDFWVGMPPRIGNASQIDAYYSDLVQDSDDYIVNLGNILDFTTVETQKTFNFESYDLITPWPSIFKSPSLYSRWLTGINAFYSPTNNLFTIPATISQVPYVNDKYPSFINYAGIGGVIGHEISHGFDPSGSYYDYEGNNVDIWTEETREAYNDNMQCFIDQYDSIEIQDGEYVDGTTTITENVADNGGVSASYAAWKKYIRENPSEYNVTLPGVDLNSEQLFFWSWGHVWCSDWRNSYYINYTNVHAPTFARVLGVAQNSQAFADAYNCPSGSAMNPQTKCKVW